MDTTQRRTIQIKTIHPDVVYEKKSEHERILLKPNVWLGPIGRDRRRCFCYDFKEEKLFAKDVTHPPAQERTFLEIAGNAADNAQRSRERGLDPKSIEITMNKTTISVKNYGFTIPLKINQETGIMNPELIFGVLGTGSNYNPNEKRLYIGTNGVGAKLCNIYSTKFIVECFDPTIGTYIQVWTNNMFKTGKWEILPIKQGQETTPGYTKITYDLDFPRFDCDSFDSESFELYAAHCAEIAFTCNIPVFFNGTKFQLESSTEYCNMFFGKGIKKISYKDPAGMYDVCFADTPNIAVHVSFVNGIITSEGGVHLDEAFKQIMANLPSIVSDSGVKLTKTDICDSVSIFLSCKLYNPEFTGQTKEKLASPKPKLEIPDNLMKKLKSWDLILMLYKVIESRQMNKLKKTDGKHRSRRVVIPKAVDANNARKGLPCALMMAEGLSALNYTTKFLKNVGAKGRDVFGTMPLSGKPLNTLNAPISQILDNVVFANIKQMLGIKEETDYTLDENYSKLRYNSVWIMTDSDDDGMHICALILLHFIKRFDSIVRKGMIFLYRTPILRGKKGKNVVKFYTEQEHKQWCAKTPDHEKWKFQYYKGLGTSTDADVKEDYNDIRLARFMMDEKAMDSIILAFDKTKAESRKEWISNFVEDIFYDCANRKEVTVSDFINKELIHFSIRDNLRSLPYLDGFKDGARMIYYTLSNMITQKKLKFKTSLVASKTAADCHYKHGEASLVSTIVRAGSTFVGANNDAFILGEESYGTRELGGKDAAQPRYILAGLSWWCSYIFRSEDERLLVRRIEENEEVEYKSYYPILPFILFNHVKGIGTAYSTNIPSFYPPQLAEYVHALLNIEDDNKGSQILPDLVPWYSGFKGKIIKTKTGFQTTGTFSVVGDTIVVTELPIKVWTVTYRDWLAEMRDKEMLKDWNDNSIENAIRFEIHGWNFVKEKPTLKSLKLINSFSFSNMTVLEDDEKGVIRPVENKSVDEIIRKFFKRRLIKYVERRELIIKEYKAEIAKLTERHRFIDEVKGKKLIVYDRVGIELEDEMVKGGYKTLNHLKEVIPYDYTVEKLSSLQKKIKGLVDSLNLMINTKPTDIWREEIDEYIKEYRKRNGVFFPKYDVL